MDSLDAFITTLNANRRGIHLTYEASRSKIHFLDLEIISNNGRLETKTYFKATDRNGYIPTDSCHHEVWLKSIPKSQLVRIRRNCSHLSDYFLQAENLKQRFCEKGYDNSLITKDIQQVALMDRASLLTAQSGKLKKQGDSKHKWSFLTNFSTQHRQVKDIIKKHWKILKSDTILGPVLPEQAATIFRGAPSIKGQIAPNVIDPPKKISFFHNMQGFYPCRRCTVCKWNVCQARKMDTFNSTTTGKIYNMKQFATCKTPYIVYLITCPCKKQYIGRTIRNFTTRVKEHITAIKKGKTNHSVSKHYASHHDRNPAGTTFQVIDRFIPHWRGESSIRGVSRLETWWIHQIKCYVPHGLNIEWDINAFINQS